MSSWYLSKIKVTLRPSHTVSGTEWLMEGGDRLARNPLCGKSKNNIEVQYTIGAKGWSSLLNIRGDCSSPPQTFISRLLTEGRQLTMPHETMFNVLIFMGHEE